jgi:hypothetical protein
MTSNTELVALRVPEVRAVVVRVVLGAKTWRPLRTSSVSQSHRVCLIDCDSVLREKGDHLSITDLMPLMIVWFADQEERTLIRM